MKIHTIEDRNGQLHEVAKLRTEDSHNLPVWHHRLAGTYTWRSLSVDTLSEAVAEVTNLGDKVR